jgi:uncharacterized membrane protein
MPIKIQQSIKTEANRTASTKNNIQWMRRHSNLITTISITLITYLLVIIVNNLPYNQFSTKMSGATVSYEIAKVIHIESEKLHDSHHQKGLKAGRQKLSVKLITGIHNGEVISASNALSTYNSVVGEEGGYLIVIIDELKSGDYKVRVYNHFRTPYIYLMILLFFAALLLVGKKKGAMAILGLTYTFLCIFTIFLPLVLRGYSPILAAIILVIMSSAVTMIALNGISRKSLCGILGTVIGVALSSLILVLFGTIMHISGFNTDDTESLLLISQTTGLRVRDLLYSGILITSLGAIMDVAMSIVSSINEVKQHKAETTTAELFNAGMNVGKDIIGTMSNTLILAFTGTSLNLLIIISSYSVQYNQYMNMNSTAIQITQALAGSLALVLTVPITASIASRLLNTSNETNQNI